MLFNATETLFSNVPNIDKNNLRWILIIDGEEYNFSYNFSAGEHAFNNIGTSLKLKQVYPKNYNDQDLFEKTFKIEKYATISLIYTDGFQNLNYFFFNGFVKSQTYSSLEPDTPKWIDIECVTNREWLTMETMDFPIIKMSPLDVLEKIVKKLGKDYITIGKVVFSNDTPIDAYNTQNKTAFQVLQFLQNVTDSLLVLTDVGADTLINFFPRNKMLSTLPLSEIDDFHYNTIIQNDGSGIESFLKQKFNYLHGVEYNTLSSQKDFWNRFQITSFEFKVSHANYANKVIVESEKVLSNTERSFKFNLDDFSETINLPFVVGAINVSKTRINDVNGNPWRRVLISEATFLKNADIIWKKNSNVISLNSRIANKGILEIVYKPVTRSAVVSQNIVEQNLIASQVGGKGIIERIEKHNDLTSLADMVRMADKYLEDGINGTEELSITSKLPIWEVGMKVIVEGTTQMKADKMDGVFIVREALYNNKGGDERFEYTLVHGIDMRNNYNAFDSMSDRDNPILGTTDFNIERNISLQQNLNLVYHNKQIDCVDLPDDMGLEEELETTLDGNDDTKNLYKYKLINLGEY